MAVTVSTTNFYSQGAFSRTRSMCWTSAGVLWTCAYSQAATSYIYFLYSTDNGATWTGNSSATITVSGYLYDAALFIDADDHAHVFYSYGTGPYGYLNYRRMASIGPSTSWSAATMLKSTTPYDYPILNLSAVAHREGTGWKAHVACSEYNGGWYDFWRGQINITSGGTITLDTYTPVYYAGYNINSHSIGVDFHHTAADPKQIQSSTPHLYFAWTLGTSVYFNKYTYSGGTWSAGTTRSLGTASTTDPFGAMFFDGNRAVVAVADTTATEVKWWERDAADTTTTSRTASSTSTGPTLAGICYDPDQNVWLIGSYSSSLRVRQWLRSSTTWQTNINIEAEALSDTKVEVPTRTKGQLLPVLFQGASNYLRFDSYEVPVAPTAPTWVTPVDFAGADVGASLVLDWTFNDPNTGDTQGKYAVRRQIGTGTLYYWRASDSTWQTTETANVSATTSLTLASGWGADGDANHKYAVKTWDAGALEGVYGAELTVVPSTPDLPTITTPTDAASWATSSITVVWTVATQTTYLVELLDSAGTSVLWSSGTLSSTSVRSQAVAYTLANGVSYKARVTTANDEGLVGTADTNSFSVAYTAPATPTLTVTGNTPTGAITVAHANPTPGGSQPTVTSCDVFVRCTAGTYPDGERPVAGAGIRVKTGLTPGADWIDYAPASGRAYQYLVRAYGNNGTTGDSAWTA